MKRLIFTIGFPVAAITAFAFQLSTPVILTIRPLGNDSYEIIAPGNSPDPYSVHCVLESTEDFVTWSSIHTNIFPHSGQGDAVTNIVQVTNAATFFRIREY
jgi:hypothetical protein